MASGARRGRMHTHTKGEKKKKKEKKKRNKKKEQRNVRECVRVFVVIKKVR